MGTLIDNSKPDFEKSLEHLKEELTTLRVGRANPMMVENILVDSYGTKTPMKQLASVTVPEARTLLIQPWDKTLSKEVEKAIINANIGISPVNEGAVIRLTIPALTEESRKELTKSVGEKMEKSRIVIRQIRDRVKDEVVKQEKANEITEDDKYDSIKQLDELIKEYNDKIKALGDAKEKEIMTI
ncbi:MAG: ribosome recycling factor [Parcubacteria group bacterium]|nr:ribosome recycling factor [Parcubacteria group bacterium]|tara:strand:- start:17743 stop:18297 length:555 start_codon:yes stop_codon:yes gene_type:complete